MGKGLDTGKTFLQGVRSKITDPEQLAAFDKVFTNETVLTEIGNGVEGQAEIDRQLQGLRTQQQTLEEEQAALTTVHQNQTAWWNQNKDALAEYKVLKAGGTVTPKVVTPPAAPAGLTQEQLNEALATERAAYLGYDRDRQRITREHFTRFNEVVDIEPLLHDPDIARLGLVGVYEKVHKPRLEKWSADQATAAEEKIRLDERQKIQAANANLPYPVPTGVGSGSPLDALTGTGAKDSVVDAATAHYQRLQVERAAGTRS